MQHEARFDEPQIPAEIASGVGWSLAKSPRDPGEFKRSRTMMHNENPYKPAVSHGPLNASFRFTLALWWVIFLHPAIALSLVYACWALTAVSLGRPPGFGEHPESELAHSLVHAIDTPAAFLILSTPLLIPTALAWGFAQPFGMSRPVDSMVRPRIACLTAYTSMLVLVAWVCYSDPFGVVYWFFD